MKQPIVVIAEHAGGEVNPVTYEMVSCAEEIGESGSASVKIVALGAEIEETARQIARTSRLPVVGIENPYLSAYNSELYKTLLADLLTDIDPSYVLSAHTTRGMDFLPGLAVRLKGVQISAVEGVARENGAVSFFRSFYNGKIVGKVAPKGRPVFLTVQPGAFEPFTPEGPLRETVELQASEGTPERLRSLGIRPAAANGSELAEAEVIVAAGKGIRKKENLTLIYRLASLFAKSAVAGSRPVCDSGWLDYKQQVGLTGAAVSPKLYIACGISGAAQHLAGMRGAAFIVAINTDPDAAVFNVADVAVVEDLTVFIPAFLKAQEASS